MNKDPTRTDPLPPGVAGFTLIELMIVLVVVGILAAVAYPSYVSYITRSRRAAAEACLSNYATYMERYYTTNMRYDQTTNGVANTLPALDCASSQNTGSNYTYGFAAGPTQSTYTIQAAPSGIQQSRDSACGTLTIDQTGQRGISGTSTVTQCW